MKLISTVIMCHECEMPYYKAFWEPMWLAKLAVKDTHAEWHDMAMNPETTPLAKAWRKWERERIIEIIERCPRVDDDYMILCDARHLIELINGENK